MTANLVSLFIVGLFTSRVSHLLVNEDAPYGLAARLRVLFGIHVVHQIDDFGNDDPIVRVVNKSPVFATFADALQCIKCTSVWVAAVASAAWLPADLPNWLLQTFVISAISIAFDRLLDA